MSKTFVIVFVTGFVKYFVGNFVKPPRYFRQTPTSFLSKASGTIFRDGLEGEGQQKTGRFVNVEIETESLLTLGMTVADWWGVSGREANANFIGDVDIEGFFNLLTERLAVL